MVPLVALGLSLLPPLTRLLVGERAGDVAATVATAVREVTGTDDPAAAEARLAADPAAAAALRVRLAEIALEGERLQAETEARRRQAELDALGARLRDVQDARGTMLGLARADSRLAVGPAAISAIVTTGFFTILGVFIFWTPPAEHQQAYSLLNIAVGALVAGFTAVVNFWIGSSQGSRDKDATVRSLTQQQTAVAGETFGRAARALTGAPAEAAPHPAPKPVAAPPVAAAPAPAQPNAAPAATRDDSPAARFARCMDIVLEREGGFVNDPADRGGPTNLGITQGTLARWRGKPVTAEEVASLSEQEAREIYRARYWNAMRCDDLPPGLDLMVFDFGVNAGPGTSVRLLQRVAGVREDGAVGPVTLGAVRLLDPAACIDRLAALRGEYYRGLGGFARFGRGWLARTGMVRRAALAMVADAAG